jgi:ATP-dependent Clp protease ATP-binding subunit ClpC
VARRLALLVAALDAAIEAVLDGSPEDARLELRPANARVRGNLAWRDRLAAMYAAWGQARGMRVRVHPADAQGVVRIELSGYAAWPSLRREAGLHVLETREGDAEARHSVRVAVHADPAAADAAVPADADTRICRRYDDGPSPLVRDTVRGWRSGRLDRVLAGDFDLIGSE